MKSLNEQAEAMLKKHKAFGQRKSDVSMIGKTQFRQFTSVRSYQETTTTLARIGRELGVSQLKEITPEIALGYLQTRKEQRSVTQICSKEKDHEHLSQKTLDAERKALSIISGQSLERVFSNNNSRQASRSYNVDQVESIKKAQTEKFSFATELSRASGLRAVELLTLRRADEDSKSTRRAWRNDRFEGLKGDLYVVTGKGGLKREVLIPKDLANKLETYRLAQPKVILDRKVKITSCYDIPGGKNFSKSFSSASNRALGFSNGAHGLRHSYAKERYEQLRTLGKNEIDAKTIVSQELGHFRPSIVEVYLR